MPTLANQTPDPAEGKPPRPRRWIPVSLRLFVAMLVLVGVGGALWIGVPAYQQHIATREIERLGGVFSTKPRGPEWLDGLLYRTDAELAQRSEIVDFVCLHGTAATNNTLEQIGRLTDLEELVLSYTQVGDAGLAHLKGLTKLKRIYLGNAPVTDAGVAELQRALPELVIER